MAKITGLGAKHFRSLYNISPSIDLKPITILVGKNSVGKSTFARLLPLLRQSAERKKRSPILWYDDLVDFGSFSQTVTRGENFIELSIRLSDVSNASMKYFPLGFFQLKALFSTAEVTIRLVNEGESTKPSKVTIQLGTNTLTIDFSTSEGPVIFRVNESCYTVPEEYQINLDQGAILPNIKFVNKKRDSSFYDDTSPWSRELVDFIRSQLHGRTGEDKVIRIAKRIMVCDLSDLKESISKIDGPSSWKVLRDEIVSGKKDFVAKKIVEKNIISNIDFLLESINFSLFENLRNVRYIKPLRASAERYYRRADLSVSEIDPEGRNLPIFLDSLSKTQFERFKNWLKEYLGFEVVTKKEGAQIVIQAKTDTDSDFSNVADMGFGVSQILPIAAQLWSSSELQSKSSVRNRPEKYVVIEQPELHLHPELQAKIGNLLAGVIRFEKEHDRKVSTLIIETHSQHLINRLGLLIEKGDLSKDDVSIVVFEPNTEKLGTSVVSVATFDDDGILENWPFGFFEPGTN